MNRKAVLVIVVLMLGLMPTNNFRGGMPEDVEAGGRSTGTLSWLTRKWYLGTGGAMVAAHPGMIGEPGEPSSLILGGESCPEE